MHLFPFLQHRAFLVEDDLRHVFVHGGERGLPSLDGNWPLGFSLGCLGSTLFLSSNVHQNLALVQEQEAKGFFPAMQEQPGSCCQWKWFSPRAYHSEVTASHAFFSNRFQNQIQPNEGSNFITLWITFLNSWSERKKKLLKSETYSILSSKFHRKFS